MIFKEKNYFLLICTLFIIVYMSGNILGLQISNNMPVFYFDTTTQAISWHNTNSRHFGLDNLSDEEEIVFEPKKSLESLSFNSAIPRIKPPILKVYLKNVTVRTGQMVTLKCPSLKDLERVLSAKNVTKQQQKQRPTSKISFQNREINTDDNLSIKTVLWTQEVNPPKLISNEESLFIKSDRFTLLSTKNKNVKTNSEKYVDLQICPVTNIDTGWYTCYIVKKSLFDQNIKYYTYLNVIENSNFDYSDENFKCNNKLSNSSSFSSSIKKNFEIKSDFLLNSTAAPVLLTNLEKKITPKVSTSTTIKTPTSSASELVDESNNSDAFYSEILNDENDQKLTEKETSNKNSNKLYVGTFVYTNRILDDNSSSENLNTDDSKNSTLKRQIDSSTITKMSTPSATTTTTKKTATASQNDLQINENFFIPNRKEYEKTSEKLADYHFQHEANLFIPKLKASKERLQVSPKLVNMSQFHSFQMDCTYYGHNYLSVKLAWFKNGNYLDLNRQQRIFLLDYKQNNSRTSILKFAYALLVDTGSYKCIAFNSNRKNTTSLNDSMNLVVNLNENEGESFLRISYFFEHHDQNAASFSTRQLNYYNYRIFFSLILSLFLFSKIVIK